ncbi:MAG TPA: amidohydrolase family protein [Pyrinomonadaceae bacterium]|nr:amidohydrolase family protein [Pyrinomonadaceae bacterium]
MSRILKASISVFTFMLLFAFAAYAQIAVKGELIWTMAGEPIQNGVILIKDGKIEKIGPASQISIPNGYQVLSAKVVTPGLIDAHTVIGLNGYLNQPHDQMALDSSSPMQPELRAIDAYNSQEKLVEWVREFGVTTIHTGHQPSSLIPGQTMIAKTWGKTIDDVTLVPTAMVAVVLGNAAIAGQGRSPGTRAKQIAMLRAELIKAKENLEKKEPPKDPRSEIMMKIAKGEIRLLITAQKDQDIISALRLAKEFNLKIVLDGVADAQLVMNEIKASGFPVIVHPTMARPGGDASNLSLETAAKLKAAGIPVALQSGYESYVPKTRVVLFEAAMAAANGLSKADALALITIDAAKILGLDNRIGSLVVGKDADLALYDGDPFEYTSHCIGTIINGQIVSQTVR